MLLGEEAPPLGNYTPAPAFSDVRPVRVPGLTRLYFEKKSGSSAPVKGPDQSKTCLNLASPRSAFTSNSPRSQNEKTM